MVVKKSTLKRSSTGVLRHRSRKLGFVKTNVLTMEAKSVLMRRAASKVGTRAKQVQETKNKRKSLKKPVQEEDVVEGAEATVIDEVKISAEDELILQSFMSNKLQVKTINDQFQKNLKLQEEERNKQSILNNPKVILVYENVADVLKIYRSGKLPKPVHILPSLEHWKDVILLTRPEEWSPQAVFACTKIFSSSMDNEAAEHYYKTVVLPAVRTSIQTDKKLNVHLYNTLIKALYKPQAWFKGILLPLCEAEDFTIKEAQIVGSIVHKHSVPIIHSSIVMFKLCQMPFSGPTAIILKVLIDKKYSLPERVIAELITYFNAFLYDQREMPVIWHQMILRLCEIYQLSTEHKNMLRKLVQAKQHHIITKEILKALNNKNKMEME